MKIDVLSKIFEEVNDIELAKTLIVRFGERLEELYKSNVKDIIVSKDVLEKRTAKEQIQLMEELKKCDYNVYARKIATDKTVLENKTIEEQIELMREEYTKFKSTAFVKKLLNLTTMQDVKNYLQNLKAANIEDVSLDENYVPKYIPENEKKDN